MVTSRKGTTPEQEPVQGSWLAGWWHGMNDEMGIRPDIPWAVYSAFLSYNLKYNQYTPFLLRFLSCEKIKSTILHVSGADER